MCDTIISVRNVTKIYGGRKNIPAITHLNLDIHDGQIIGLIGANGSGKTTFFEMCAGMEDITSGQIEILGGNALTDVRINREMIYSKHNLPVGDGEKLKNIIGNYSIAYRRFDRAFAEKLVEIFSLSLKQKYGNMSQGMKSTFNLICAIAARCRVTFLDEPFIGIDIEKRKRLYEIILRDYMEHPRLIMISSHNLGEMEHILSEMILIDQGELIFYKDMDDIREMMCRISGDEGILKQFRENISAEKICYSHMGELGNMVVLMGTVNCPEAIHAREMGLGVSAVSTEDVCVYMTGNRCMEEKIDSLWTEGGNNYDS